MTSRVALSRSVFGFLCVTVLAMGTGSAFGQAPAGDGVNPQASEGSIPVSEPLIDFNNPTLIMEKGGYLMWPILLCSVVTFTFALERLISLRKGRVLPRRFLRRFMTELQQGKLNHESAVERCRTNGSPAAMVILSAVRRWGRPMSEIELAITEGGEREVAMLRRNLRALQGSANLATLLGLLGTVIGMILAFNEVAIASGQPRAEMLASGIAQALLTTAFGLAVAIPSLFLHNYFSGKVERLVYQLDQSAMSVAELISAESSAERSRPAEAVTAHPQATIEGIPAVKRATAASRKPAV